MECKKAREELVEMASKTGRPEGAAGAHLEQCAECAAELDSLRKTMALLEEWSAPEPSPYFDTRLQARLREQQAETAGWPEWLRRPALALSLSLLLVLSIVLFQGGKSLGPEPVQVAKGPAVEAPVGSAVADLQTLDQNQELLADFELLDDFQFDDNGVGR